MYADTVGANKGRGKRQTMKSLGVLPSFYIDCVGSREKILHGRGPNPNVRRTARRALLHSQASPNFREVQGGPHTSCKWRYNRYATPMEHLGMEFVP